MKTSPHCVHWETAMFRKLKGLVTKNTFSPVTDPPDIYVAGARWVFKWSTNCLGKVVNAKARLWWCSCTLAFKNAFVALGDR